MFDIKLVLKVLSHRAHRAHRNMKAEDEKKFSPAPSKQIPQALAFAFGVLNLNPSVAKCLQDFGSLFVFPLLANLFQIFLPLREGILI